MPGGVIVNGKVVFVTGAGDGIGRGCAAAYAAQGAHVVVADIRAARARETVTQRLAVECDAGDGDSVHRAIDEALSRFGKLDAVHNNVGLMGPAKPLEETSSEEWDGLERINLKSVYWTTRHAIAALKLVRGAILNTASMVGIMGLANHAAYLRPKGA